MSRYAGFRVNGWTCNFTTFSASELTAMTGMSGPLVRLWRNRGQLPGGGRPEPTFSSRDVAEIMIRYDLSLFGVAPGQTAEIGCEAARYLLWFALLNMDGACEIVGTEDDCEQFLKQFEKDAGIANALVGLNGKDSAFRYLVSQGRDDLVFLKAEEDLANTLDSRRVFYIDLDRAAYDLMMQAQRPLYSIDVSGDAIGRRVRRLTGRQ